MTFWHNERYKTLDKASFHGDSMRGLPATHFPWLLKESSFRDESGDMWQLKTICTQIEVPDFTQKVTTKLRLEAVCIVCENNLKNMDFEFQRLTDLDLTGWNVFEENCFLTFPCLMEKIKEKSLPLNEEFFKKLKEKYTFSKKKEMVKTNIQNCRVSNFS